MVEVCLPRLDWDRVEALSLHNPLTPFGLMRFRLIFTGGLSSGGNTGQSRVAEKWAIRKQLRPQLAELHERHPVLRDFQKVGVSRLLSNQNRVTLIDQTPYDDYLRVLREPIEVEGFKFVPLVRDSLKLTCSLDITFLRREEAALYSKHDIDNRIKTLLDGLAMPQPGGGIVAGDRDKSPEMEPFHVLLQDDALITGLAVRTDRYLGGPALADNAVMVMMDVTVSVVQLLWSNIGFLQE